MRIALRTQQVIAEETGVTNTIDPLGGSYFVEALTDELEAQAYAYFDKIDELGGMVAAVKRNYPQREIAEASFRYQQELDAGRRRMVGVNALHRGRRRRPDPASCASTRRWRASRSSGCARPATAATTPPPNSALRALVDAAADERHNLMPGLLDAARAHCTEGEIVDALQTVFGTYTETPVF